MGKIHRIEQQAKTVTRFGRSDLEDFPEEPVALEPGAEGEAAEAPLDPEEIRAAVYEEAKAEAERMVQEAYQEGLARGEAAGEQAFAERVAGIAEMTEQLVQEIAAQRSAFLDTLEPQVVELVRAMAEQALARECGEETQALTQQAAGRALEMIADAHAITVRVHPDSLEAMKSHRADLLDRFRAIAQLRIEADESLEPGGCTVETEESLIDAQPSVMLRQIIDDVFGGGDGTA